MQMDACHHFWASDMRRPVGYVLNVFFSNFRALPPFQSFKTSMAFFDHVVLDGLTEVMV
jgi:hypothetical protein